MAKMHTDPMYPSFTTQKLCIQTAWTNETQERHVEKCTSAARKHDKRKHRIGQKLNACSAVYARRANCEHKNQSEGHGNANKKNAVA
jgi:hypothetical protein